VRQQQAILGSQHSLLHGLFADLTPVTLQGFNAMPFHLSVLFKGSEITGKHSWYHCMHYCPQK